MVAYKAKQFVNNESLHYWNQLGHTLGTYKTWLVFGLLRTFACHEIMFCHYKYLKICQLSQFFRTVIIDPIWLLVGANFFKRRNSLHKLYKLFLFVWFVVEMLKYRIFSNSILFKCISWIIIFLGFKP